MGLPTSLLIKYGLSRNPTDSEIQFWLRELEVLLALGIEPEIAGLQAAAMVLPDAGSHKYASQADTILALLAEAKKK